MSAPVIAAGPANNSGSPADAVSAPDDPTLGTVDLETLRLSHVRDRLAQVPATTTPTDAVVIALALAAEDLLALREMEVLHQFPQPGERPWQAADRFAQSVWRAKDDCDADPADVKLLYLQALSRFKHPSKWAIWDAQLQCCPDPDACDFQTLEACRQATRAEAEGLAADMAHAQAALPALGPAADVTDVTLEASPVKGVRTDAFERVVAKHSDAEKRWALRRYDFFAQGEPGFARGPFRPGEPAIQGWVKTAKLGAISGPIATVWGWSVVQLVAREPLREGKADPEIMRRLTREACAEMAERSRQHWRDGLLAGAQVRWKNAEIERILGPGIVAKLPAGRRSPGQMR